MEFKNRLKTEILKDPNTKKRKNKEKRIQMLKNLYILVLLFAVLLTGAVLTEETTTTNEGGVSDDDGSPEATQAEINALLKEEGLSDEDIAEIARINSQDPESAWDELGAEGKLVKELVGDTNDIINQVNNINQLKKQTAEAQILSDSMGIELGEDNELTESPEDKAAQAAYDKEAAKPLTEEQKEQLRDLEHDLNDIDSDEFDIIDL